MTFVRVEGEGPVVVVTISRPDKLNALSPALIAELRDAFAALGARFPTVRCAILTGDGKAFVAGADIAEMKDMGVEEARAFSALGHACGDVMEGLPFPVIAAVNGFALGGGCELTLACDFAIASEKAKLGQPEVKLGVIPGFGGTQRLARRVGIAKARELVYTGATIDAATAKSIGLVSEVVAPDALMPRAQELAQQIASMGPVAIREAKRAFREGEGRPLREANAVEMGAFAACFASEDQKEGMAAFVEKRAPAFKGK